MDKISSILPKSKRVSTVDMKDAAPVRPGTPSFGRPEGVSSLRETTSSKVDWKARDGANAEIAKNISDKFFSAREKAIKDGPQDLVTIRSDISAEEMPVELALEPESDADAPTKLAVRENMNIEEPQGLYPKGSFIDYTV